MKNIGKILKKILIKIWRFILARKNVAVRFVLMLFYSIIHFFVHIALLILSMLQFLVLFLTVRHSEAIKTLSHRLVTYAYKLTRYITLNENEKPFPFHSFPEELELAEPTDLTNPLPPLPEEDVTITRKKAETTTPPPGTGKEETAEVKPSAAEEKEEVQEAIILDHKNDKP